MQWLSGLFYLICYLMRATVPFLLITLLSLVIPSAIQTYTPLGCSTPPNFPSQPSFSWLVEKMSCPHRLNTRKYLIDLIPTGNGMNLSFLPSPFGLKPVGT